MVIEQPAPPTTPRHTHRSHLKNVLDFVGANCTPHRITPQQQQQFTPPRYTNLRYTYHNAYYCTTTTRYTELANDERVCCNYSHSFNGHALGDLAAGVACSVLSCHRCATLRWQPRSRNAGSLSSRSQVQPRPQRGCLSRCPSTGPTRST
jgi:hypothetical protein